MANLSLKSCNVLSGVTAALVALLVWNANALICRIDNLEDRIHALEANQIRIMTKLGIEPITCDTPTELGGSHHGRVVCGYSRKSNRSLLPETLGGE